MHSLLPLLFLLVIAAAVVPLARSRRARRRQLAALALRCGWTYTPTDPWDLAGEMDGLWLGTWGHDRCFRDVFSIPTQTGALWLARFNRQMGSGRSRRTERFAVAVARMHALSGGILILPASQPFVPADPFARYRPVPALDDIDLSGRQVWAERPASQRSALVLLSGLMLQLPPEAGIEVRGPVAAVYWPLAQPVGPQDFLDLQTAGRWLQDLLDTSPAAPGPSQPVSSPAWRGTP
jgi:hypothetical protein